MVVNADLCREILLKYADEHEFPSQIQFEELQKLFANIRTGELEFNVIALDEAELLLVDWERIETGEGVSYEIYQIDGINFQKGSEFVQNSRKSERWEQAKEACIRALGEISLQRLKEYLEALPL